MMGETDLKKMLRTLRPALREGDWAFCRAKSLEKIPLEDVLFLFREREAVTVIIEKSRAESLGLEFDFVAAWIELTVHSSLEAVGLTAAFSAALAANGISCNVVAAFFHDHIFVEKRQAQRAIQVLETLSKTA